MKSGISVCMVVHNEEAIISKALENIKDIADEILILHDGPCGDNTLKIARKYTKNVFETKKNAGVPGPIIPQLLRRVKYEWILKIDADESLSKELKKNIRKLIQNSRADAYTFKWPTWNGKKYTTKNWPRKLSLYRISKISYFGFPHWDEPKINGLIVPTDFHLEHHPPKYAEDTWHNFVEKGLKRYGRLQAEYTLKNFKEFDSFQYPYNDFPIQIRIRRDFPLLSAFPFAVLATLKTLFSGGAWKEGKHAYFEAGTTGIYYLWLGWYIHKLKIKQK